MVEFLEVRLVMNSLRRKGVDIIRQLINELAVACAVASTLDNQGVAWRSGENAIMNRPSQNHSYDEKI